MSANRVPASGPETMGAEIQLPDRTVKLPDDAYIAMHTISVMCIAGHECPDTPLHMISRGNSLMEFDRHGRIIYQEIAPGEEDIFGPVIAAFQSEVTPAP